MWKEFKAFAMKGSVLDMAIGIIIGVAFGQIIQSLVSDIIMPPLGLLLCHVSGGEVVCQHEEAGISSAANHEGLPLLLQQHPPEGFSLPPLHFSVGASVRMSGQGREFRAPGFNDA